MKPLKKPPGAPQMTGKSFTIEDFLVNRKLPYLSFALEDSTEWRLNAVRDIFNNRNGDETTSGDNGISLAEGGCLMRPHHSVLEALMNTIHNYKESPFQIYPQLTIDMKLIDRVTEFFKSDCNIPAIASDHVCLGIGSGHLFDIFLGATCQSGDIILTPESYYHAFAEWPSKWGGHLVSIKTQADQGYKLTAQQLEDWLESNATYAKKAKTLLLCSPTTTGALYSQEELEALSVVIQKNNMLVFSDEVFRGSEFKNQKTVSIASINGMAERTVTTHSGSKTRGTADFRIGWGCGPEALIDRMIGLLEQSITEVPLYLQKIALAALDTPSEYLDIAAEEYETRTALIRDEIAAINARLRLSFGLGDKDIVSIPYYPQSGHYVMLSFETLKGWQTPDGKPLFTCADLTRHFANYSEKDEHGNVINQSVVFSSGYSKGHDDMVLYIAFAQPGYLDMSKAMHDFERRKVFTAYLKSNSSKHLAEDEIAAYAKVLGLDFMAAEEADYANVAKTGHAILREALKRMEKAIGVLERR